MFENPAEMSCPECATPNPLEIVYGLPSTEMHLAEMEGSIALGGDITISDSPAYRCRECGVEFGAI